MLLIEKGANKGESYSLKEGQTISIGRAGNCDITLDDEMISRHHCKIRLQNSIVKVADLKSRNGTQINYRTVIEPVELKPGDVIQVGETEIRLNVEKIDPLIGRTIANYRFIERLGRGGQGTVYLGEQVNLEREVSIKVLDESLAGQEKSRQRFVQEAQMAATMNHHRLIGVYDIVDNGDVVFFSMEFMPGGSLSDLIAEKKKLPPKQVIRYLREAAEGLVHLHEKGMVHRDIKPANLMFDKEGKIKLGDFGTTGGGISNVEDGNVMGSPSFMSPEHIQGLDLDCRSDLYSLGCTAFRLMAGMPPFIGNTVREILEGHLNQPAPSFKGTIPQLNTKLAVKLDRLLAKHPEERYETPQDFIDALDGKSPSGPSGEGDTEGHPASKRRRRKRIRIKRAGARAMGRIIRKKKPRS